MTSDHRAAGNAASLMARLLGAAARHGIMRVLPLWADGGAPGGDPVLEPGRHVLAAFPSHVWTKRCEDLGPGGLVPFLRQVLPPTSAAPLPLVVVALAFDAGRTVSGHERLFRRPPGRPRHRHDALPDVLVARYDGYLESDAEHGPWRAVGDIGPLLDALAGEPLAAPPLGALPLVDTAGADVYQRGFAAIAEGIAAGDFYQVNLARRLEARWRSPADGPSLAAAASALHRAWRAAQPTSFAALLPLGERAWLISGSPECLLAWDGVTRIARSYPIKGTLGRGHSPAEDASLRRVLRDSAKDQAEHVMIVDLVRNDLGRVATTGSVSVPAMFAELSLATLRHLVSEVRAHIAPEWDLADLIGALFPGGSVTGAPKIAALAALDRHEPFNRGMYCGSLGIVRGGREATFSILIRTAVIDEASLTYCAGGGLVADSQAAVELAETELKASALARALADFARTRL